MSEKRRLGNSELSVTAVGLGCMGFSHAYGAPTERSEATRMIRKAFDMGYDFFDTAECYTGTNVDGTFAKRFPLPKSSYTNRNTISAILTKAGNLQYN